MFMLIGRAEKAGSGVDKIMSGWKESHWRRPFLQLESQPDRVKLTMPMFSVIPDDTLNELNSIFADISSLSADELTVLSFCLIEGSISNHRMQYVFNMHSVDITAMLKKLCEAGFLESDNNGRWTVYKIKRKVDTLERRVENLGKKVDIKLINNRLIDDGPANSDKKVDTSDRKVDTSDGKIVRSRLNKEELEELIMRVCKNDYIKMEEVATMIGKSVDYLKNKVFPKMIKDGKLEKHFPYTHNHPEQGYKTAEEYAKTINAGRP